MNRRAFVKAVTGVVTSAVCVGVAAVGTGKPWSYTTKWFTSNNFDTNGIQFDVWDNGKRVPWKVWQKRNRAKLFYAGDVVCYDGNVLKKWEG